MIRSIRVRGIGPHADRTVTFPEPMGTTVISGPSEAGKSTLMDALALALWGEDRRGAFNRALISDGHDEAAVEVELVNGTRLKVELAITPGGARKYRRIYERGIEIAEIRTKSDWADRLGLLGRRREIIRPVLFPQGWQTLAQGPGGGRPLRDLLLAVTAVGAVDVREVVGELMASGGGVLADEDPVDAKGAEQLRKRTRAAYQTAVGRHEQAIEARDSADLHAVEAPAPEALVEAEGIIAAGGAWDAHDAALGRHRAALVAVEERARRVAFHKQRVAALGPRPEEPSEADVSAATEALTAATRERDETRERLALARREERARLRAADRRAADNLNLHLEQRPVAPVLVDLTVMESRVGEARVRRDALDGQAPTDTCPTCERPGWPGAVEQHAEALAAARAEFDAALSALESAVTARDEARRAYQVALDAWQEQSDTLSARLSAATDALDAFEAETDAAAAAATAPIHARISDLAARSEQLHDLARAAATWDKARLGIGDAPEGAAAPTPPTPPPTRRPTDDELLAATETLRVADRASADHERVEHESARLDAEVTRRTEERERLEAATAHADALVAATRHAPTVALDRQLAALGDIGPVTIRPAGEGGVDVLVDGRPWYLASDGRLVVADLWLRAGMRRALGLSWLPIWVDRAQDVAGQELPDVGGPVVLLETTAAAWAVR